MVLFLLVGSVCCRKRRRTAVESVCVGVLGSELIGSIGGRVLDLGQLAELGSAEHVSSVDEEGGRSSCENVAIRIVWLASWPGTVRRRAQLSTARRQTGRLT